MSNWRDGLRVIDGGGDQESSVAWLDRVGPKVRDANAELRREDAVNLKRRLRSAALRVDQVYDEVKDICGDVHMDGHSRAAAIVGGALLNLKLAEEALEKARELVMAETQRR